MGAGKGTDESAGDVLLQSSPRRIVLDLATLLGLAGGMTLVVTAMVLGGSASSFVNLPSMLIVLGGTIFVTMISFTLPDMGRSLGVLRQTVLRSQRDPKHAAVKALRLADVIRWKGMGALAPMLGTFRSEEVLFKGLHMIVDGLDPDEIERNLGQAAQANAARQYLAADVLRKAAEIAPAMGLIGTLVGLVQMLGRLDDPSAIGPAMAVALLTTFYGAILANMVLAPLAAKLDRNAAEDELVAQVFRLCVLSISRQENPRRLEMQLNAILPPRKRVSFFD